MQQTNMRAGVRACVSSPELKDSRNPKPVPLAALVASFLPVSVPAAPLGAAPAPRIATLLVAWDVDGVASLCPLCSPNSREA